MHKNVWKGDVNELVVNLASVSVGHIKQIFPLAYYAAAKRPGYENDLLDPVLAQDFPFLFFEGAENKLLSSKIYIYICEVVLEQCFQTLGAQLFYNSQKS